jgi:hypothetical protein
MKVNVRLVANVTLLTCQRLVSAGFFFVASGIISRRLGAASAAELIGLGVCSTATFVVQAGLAPFVIREAMNDGQALGSQRLQYALTVVGFMAVVGYLAVACSALVRLSASTPILYFAFCLAITVGFTQTSEWIFAGWRQNVSYSAIYILTYSVALLVLATCPPHTFFVGFLELYTPPVVASVFVLAFLLSANSSARKSYVFRGIPPLRFFRNDVAASAGFSIFVAIINYLPMGIIMMTPSTRTGEAAALRLIFSVTSLLVASVAPASVLLAARPDNSQKQIIFCGLIYIIMGMSISYTLMPAILKLWLGQDVQFFHTRTLFEASLVAGLWLPSAIYVQMIYLRGQTFEALLMLGVASSFAVIGFFLTRVAGFGVGAIDTQLIALIALVGTGVIIKISRYRITGGGFGRKSRKCY